MTKETFKKAQEIAQLINVAEDAEFMILETNTGISLQITRIDTGLKEKIKLREFFEEIKGRVEDFMKSHIELLNDEFSAIGEETEVPDGN